LIATSSRGDAQDILPVIVSAVEVVVSTMMVVVVTWLGVEVMVDVTVDVTVQGVYEVCHLVWVLKNPRIVAIFVKHVKDAVGSG
jgi:hypothetical protein